MNFINTTTIRRSVRGAAILAVFATLACDNTSGPPEDPFAGDYDATTFITTTAGVSRNELAAGSTIWLGLSPAGFAIGHMHIAASGSNPAADTNLSGIWSHSGSTVSVETMADTFIENMAFTHSGETLVGDEVFDGTRVQVVLTRR